MTAEPKEQPGPRNDPKHKALHRDQHAERSAFPIDPRQVVPAETESPALKERREHLEKVTGRIAVSNPLIFSSEPIDGDNVWTELEDGDIIGVDWRMRLTRAHMHRHKLPMAAES